VSRRLVLVRHGKAAAGWGDDPDPGLDPSGRAQAEHMAAAVAADGRPRPILVSPLRRTRETAAALEQRWGVAAAVDEAVGEIPSPTDDLAERAAWLAEALQGTWADLGPVYAGWRQRVVERLVATEEDTVVVTHFVAINAAVGAALGDDRVVSFRPGYCSQTVLDVGAGGLRVVSLGDGSATRVL
jgi:broad specificity phosphatase PhoE